MASEPRDRSVSSELPESLDEWLDGRAEETDASREDLLAALVGAYRVAVDGDPVDADELAAAMGLDEREDQLRQSFERRLEALEGRNEEALDDVRKRVVQLKEATQEKADADHSHPELERLDDLVATVEEMDDALEAAEATLADHDERIDGMADDLEDVREKLTQVARAVVKLRDGEADRAVDHDATGPAGSDALLDIKREAARKDIRQADCGACGESVSVALLPEAACPHCEAPLAGIRDASGLFDSPRLTGPADGETR